MGKVFWVLALVALILVYVFGAFIWVRILRNRKLKRLALQEPPEEPDHPLIISEDSPDSGQSEHDAAKDLLKRKYNSARKTLQIPPNAALTARRTDVFCLPDRDIAHYCWNDGSNICFFPQWESIEAGLDAGGIRNYIAGDENTLYMLKVPKGSVGYWRTLPDGAIQLAYAPKLGETTDLLLDTAVAAIFDELMPEKELGYLMKHVYPRSPQNIVDIGKEYARLHRAWKKGRITDEEYDNNKKRILITM